MIAQARDIARMVMTGQTLVTDTPPDFQKTTHLKLAVLIVTFNSQQDLQQNLTYLNEQTIAPDLVLVVDCASSDQNYLDDAASHSWRFALTFERLQQNIGYAGGNNHGLKKLHASNCDFVLVLNPDAFLVDRNSIQALLQNAIGLPPIFLAAPVLKSFDRSQAQITDLIDSAGLIQTFLGRWRDRFQGEVLSPSRFAGTEEVVGLCGAALLIPQALLSWLLTQRQQVFDASFFMYKEDIELSCFLRQNGIQQFLFWDLAIGHCRGWKKSRKEISNWARMLSAKNDVKVAWRYRWLSLPFAIAKLLAVKLFDK